MATYAWRQLQTKLQATYGWDADRIYQIMWIARTYGLDCEPVKGGILDIRWNKLDNTYTIRER